MNRRFLYFAISLLLGIHAHATTYFISTTGSDSGNGGVSQPWATFAHAWTGMHGGDTLTVNCGTYAQEVRPPSTLSGTSAAYTTIQAATDWCVTIDGSSVIPAGNGTIELVNMSYVVVRGMKFTSSPGYTGGQMPVVVNSSDHIKLIKTAAYNAPCTDNTDVYDIGPGGSYVLVEDSYAWGCGRYKFEAYQSDHVIIRHSVARHDYHDMAGWTSPYSGGSVSGWGRQCGLFVMYDSYQVLFQNDIGLDSGLADNSTGNVWGAVWSENNDCIMGTPTTGCQTDPHGISHGSSGQDNSGSYEGNMFINLNGYFSSPAIQDPKVVGTRILENNAFANTAGGYYTDRVVPDQTASVTMQHTTAYNVFAANNYNGAPGGGLTAVELSNNGVTKALIEDSIIQKMNAFGVADYMTSDYNLFYLNPGNFGAVGYGFPVPSAGPHDVTANPQLKYITRVEPGTPGSGTASDGGNRGATILYRMGTPGTLWGDVGYDTLTTTPLWPWDDQAVIKTDMASFSMTNPVAGGTISGARGFAASGNGLYGGPITLTSYVWEQLGNACPADCQTQSAFLGTTGFTLSVSSAGSGSGTISGKNCTTGSYASGTSYSCTATPASGSMFASWTSTCGGTASGTTYNGTISAACTVTATFNLSVTTYNLTVSNAGTGSGTISGTNCASGAYASGTSVTCTATPGSGSTFAGWSGACNGTGACSFTLSANSTVTATFNPAAVPLALGLGTCSSTMTGTQYVAFAGCTLAASGGTPPYTYSWKVVTDGSYASLPEGLSLGSSTGTISGTVYGQGRYVPQFAVTDSVGTTATLSTLFFSISGDNSLGGCSLFPSDSIFHQRVDSLPVDTSPAAPIYSAYQSSALRVFFGNGGNGNIPNGIPFVRVPYSESDDAVTTTVYQSYFSSGPFPSYAPPEGTSNNSGDRHVLVVQTAGGGNSCSLWEMWQGIYQGNNAWDDSSNADWSNIGSTGTGAYAMLPQDNGSTDAAGLPITPFLVNADEVIGTGTPSTPNGSVHHPVRFTVNHMLNQYVWPATAHAGTGSCSGGYSDGNGMLLQGAGVPTSCTMTGPAGEIYRLKASVATPACVSASPQAAIIIQGFRNYGIILADNGLTGGLIGTPDARWNDTDLSCLTSLTLSDFEPVNVSGVAATLTPNYNGSGYSAPVTSYQTTSGAPTLTGITVAPATASIVVGTGTQQYAAQCGYSNNTSADCTTTVTWSSSNTAAASITAGGLASGVTAGTSTIKATSGSVSGTAVLTVINPTLTAITVTPATASIVAGTGTQQYAAQCSYSNNTNSTCTTTVTWSSSNTAAATINAAGLASAVAAGTATIKATSGSITGSAVLTIAAPTLTGITVTPATASIVAGTGTQQYAAQCTYSNNTNSACTTTVTWSSSNTSAATISAAGLGSAVAAGTTTIKATSGSVTGSATLVVTAPTLTAITVSPASASISAVTGTQQYAAQCAYSNHTNSSCTTTVIWSSSNQATATINTVGLATGVSAGTATITAASGSISGTAALTVKSGGSSSNGSWTWIGGKPGPGKTKTAVVYSPMSQLVAPDSPDSRDASVTWVGNDGRFWLFGGSGLDAMGVDGYLSDVWQYNPASQKWTWEAGHITVPAANKGWSGVYGTLAKPASGNSPGGRQSSVSWTDRKGNFWIYGGIGYDSAGTNGILDDLWEFNPSTQQWSWMGGSSTVPAANQGSPGVYDQIGVAAAADTPGARWGANSWTDASGNLWLLGGIGYDSSGTLGPLNDLWELDPSTREWVWMGGSNKAGTSGQAGSYGPFGYSATTNLPSARSQAVTWTDSKGNLWLFGGKGYDSLGTLGYLNDLWEFNPSTLEWAWMGGSKVIGCAGCGAPGIYGSPGQPGPVNVPGSRSQAVAWTDKKGNLWLLGGNGFDSAGTVGILNDLWEFAPSTQQWTWMSGSNTVPAPNQGEPGVYGQLGVPNAANTPASRWGGAAWADSRGNLWMFGGGTNDSTGAVILDDLWVYQPVPGNLPAAVPTLSVGSGTYNSVQTVSLTDATPGATIYYTTNGSTPGASSNAYGGPITLSATKTINAVAVAKGYAMSEMVSATYTITPKFSIAPAAGSATNVSVQSGGVAKYNLVLTPIGSSTLIAPVNLTASGLPPGATASFTPGMVASGKGTSDVSLAIHTSTTSASRVSAGSKWTIALCLLFIPLFGLGRRNSLPVIRTKLLAAILVLGGLSMALSGCASSYVLNNNASGQTTPTAYTVTVTAASGQVHQTTTVTVTLQ